jgi:predicted MFS family arabinose efflux permease
VVLIGSAIGLPGDLGRSKAKAKFKQLLSPNRGINILSAARLFLFGARDTWFVVGVPLFLAVKLSWDDTKVGAFLAAWVIGYGIIQAGAPRLIARFTGNRSPGRGAAQVLAFILTAVTIAMPVAIVAGTEPGPTILIGLGVFGVVFALNSSVHSYLVLAYADGDKVAMQVGFYYMANAMGRLLGTILSGVLAARAGVTGCLWVAAVAAAVTGFISLALPVVQRNVLVAGEVPDGD